MRPSDIYALPTIETVAWYEETWGRLRHMFADGDELSQNLDANAARDSGDDALRFETKLEAQSDHDRGVRYSAVTFEGRPVAILIGYGRGKDDHLLRFVTDMPAYRAAREYVEVYLHRDAEAANERVGVDEEIPELSGVYDHRIVTTPKGAQLVPTGLIDPDGNPILDHAAFREAVERTVMPAVRGNKVDQRGPEGLALTAQAILDSLGEGVVGTADFVPLKREPKAYRKLDWEGVLVASGDNCYLVGTTSYGRHGYLGWTTAVEAERIGGRDLYDALARDTGTAPRP